MARREFGDPKNEVPRLRRTDRPGLPMGKDAHLRQKCAPNLAGWKQRSSGERRDRFTHNQPSAEHFEQCAEPPLLSNNPLWLEGNLATQKMKFHGYAERTAQGYLWERTLTFAKSAPQIWQDGSNDHQANGAIDLLTISPAPSILSNALNLLCSAIAPYGSKGIWRPKK